MDQEIVRMLDQHNWEEGILKLTAYAISLCRWLKPSSLPHGLEPEDLVMDAIDKVYNGVRKWDPENDPDLHKYLMSVIKSILSNTISLTENHIVYRVLVEDELLGATENTETELYAKQLDQIIAAAMKGDPELCLVYKALKDGLKPAEIAAEYALKESNVRNAQKRLNRLVHNVLDSLTKSLIV